MKGVATISGSAAMALASFLPPAAARAQDAAAFAPCAACHAIEADAPPRLGPNLAGVTGRKAGTLPGYGYSAAMKNVGIVWTAKTLDAFLQQPQGTVKGTKMPFGGLADPTKRAAVIAYLATLK